MMDNLLEMMYLKNTTKKMRITVGKKYKYRININTYFCIHAGDRVELIVGNIGSTHDPIPPQSVLEHEVKFAVKHESVVPTHETFAPQTKSNVCVPNKASITKFWHPPVLQWILQSLTSGHSKWVPFAMQFRGELLLLLYERMPCISAASTELDLNSFPAQSIKILSVVVLPKTVEFLNFASDP